jgi:hypothetical protein
VRKELATSGVVLNSIELVSDQVEEDDEMGGACSANVGGKECV